MIYPCFLFLPSFIESPQTSIFTIIVLLKGALITHMGFFIQCGIIGFPIQMDYLLRVLNQWHKKIQSCSIWNNVESLKNYIKHHIQFLTYVESWNCIILLFEPIFCVSKLKDVWIVLWQLACLLGISHSLGLTPAINIF